MRVLFCCNPLDRRVVDPAYEPEAAAAQAAGLACDLICNASPQAFYEALTGRTRALRVENAGLV